MQLEIHNWNKELDAVVLHSCENQHLITKVVKPISKAVLKKFNEEMVSVGDMGAKEIVKKLFDKATEIIHEQWLNNGISKSNKKRGRKTL